MFALLLVLSQWGQAAISRPDPEDKFTARRTLYCSGVRMSATYVWNEAVCFGRAPWRAYRLRVIGGGASLQLVGSLMRLRVDYDVTRYDAAFDPWPGEYYAVISGAAVGPRGSADIFATAGNKTIRGSSYDLGLGFDLTLAALLVIE